MEARSSLTSGLALCLSRDKTNPFFSFIAFLGLMNIFCISCFKPVVSRHASPIVIWLGKYSHLWLVQETQKRMWLSFKHFFVAKARNSFMVRFNIVKKCWLVYQRNNFAFAKLAAMLHQLTSNCNHLCLPKTEARIRWI